MGDKSAIEWTQATWNPIVGCTRVSAGCTHCYAERQAYRCAAMGITRYRGLTKKVGSEIRWTGNVRLVEDALDLPLRWRRPRRIFVNSMNDLFHERVPAEWIDRIFAVMAWVGHHTYQVLTKRADRMRAYCAGMAALDPKERSRRIVASMYRGHPAEYLVGGVQDRDVGDFPWPLSNVHLGVSVEDQATADERIPLLLQTSAAVRWVSYEPALGAVDFRPWLAPCDGVTWLCERCGFRLGRAVLHLSGQLSVAEPPGREVCPNDGVTLVPDRRLDWIVVGGESGPGARPFDLAWARSVIAQCRAAGVACFVKQLGALPVDDIEVYKYRHGELLPEKDIINGRARYYVLDRKGGDPSEWPEDLMVREFPNARMP